MPSRLLLPILLLALALRLYAIGFGLPLAEARPDELTIAFQAMKFGTMDFNPHSFNYPSLFKYLMFGLFGGYFVVGKLVGWFGGQEDFLREFFSGAVNFRLLMRVFSAFMGTLGVALLGRVSPVAAFFLAISFLHVRDSHFGVTDVTMVSFALAAVLAAESLRTGRTTRHALLAGFIGGLATSIKYNAALTAIPIALACLGPGVVSLGGAAALAMVGGFLLGTPYALLDFPTFYKDFSYEANHLATGHYVDVGTGWVHHLTKSLRYGLGLPLLGAGLVGLGLAVWQLAGRQGRQAVVLYSFPVVYFLLIGRGETAFYRYILPVVPFLCLAAGLAVERSGRLRWPLALVIALPSIASSVQALRLMGAGDTRDAMGRYIEASIPTDTVIVHAGTYSGAPMLQRNVVNQTREYAAKAGRSDSAGFRKPDDLRWYDAQRPMYDVQFVEKTGIDFASQRPLDAILSDPPPYLLIEDYFLVHYSSVPDAIHTLAAERYTLLHTEAAWVGDVQPVFDQQDAFYLPVAGFSGFTRMGPTLHLFRRNDP